MNRVTMVLAAGLVFLAAASLPVMRAGALQAVVTDDNLDQMIASAKTPEDHQKLAAYYLAEAGTLEAEAKDHEELATTYRKRTDAAGVKHPMSGKTAAHCDYFAKSVREAAKADR